MSILNRGASPLGLPYTFTRSPRHSLAISGPLRRKTLQIGFRSRDHVVQRVALVGFAAGAADEAADGRRRHRLGRFGAGRVINPLFLNGAVEVVSAVPQRELRRFDAGRNPE